jgi:uncharacterized integral membrane protein
VHDPPAKSWIHKDSVRIRLLCIGLATLSLILLNDVRYVASSPLYVIVMGTLINGGLIAAIAVELRKIYKRGREDKTACGDKASVS